jgi:hypothetical protein
MAYSSAFGAGVWIPLKTLAGLVYGVEALVVGSVAINTGVCIQLGFSVVQLAKFDFFRIPPERLVQLMQQRKDELEAVGYGWFPGPGPQFVGVSRTLDIILLGGLIFGAYAQMSGQIMFGARTMDKYGMYGEVVLAPIHALVKHPKGLSPVEAAAIWMMFVTA